MRFVSTHRGYELTLRNERITGFTQSGDPIYGEGRLKALFQDGGVSPWEAEYALKHLSVRGLPEGVEASERLSWFDTEWAQRQFGWTDEERELVEEKMLNMPDRLGVHYVMVEQPKAEKPWPSYDQLSSPKRIVALMQETGATAEAVLRYEQENRNRQDVIDAVSAAASEVKPAESDTVVVNA